MQQLNPQRNSFRLGTPFESYEDQLLKSGLEVKAAGQISQQKLQQQQSSIYRKRNNPRGSDTSNLNTKWTKSSSSGDGDCRRVVYAPSIKNMQEFGQQTESVDTTSACTQLPPSSTPGPSIGLTHTRSWKSLSNHRSPNTPPPLSRSYESDDTDNASYERRNTPKYETTPRTDSPHSKSSSLSFNEDLLNDSPFNTTAKDPTTMLLEEEVDNQTRSLVLGTSTSATEINFIMLLGLVLGLIISKALQYLQLYFSWFQNQVLQLRSAFLGQSSFWEFFNFEDNSRYGMRTKLMLLPLVGTCSLLYVVVAILHSTIRFLLTQAPTGLVAFIERLYSANNNNI